MVVVSLHTQCLRERGDVGKIWKVFGNCLVGVISTCSGPRKEPSTLFDCKPATSEFNLCELVQLQEDCVVIEGCYWLPEWLAADTQYQFKSRCVSGEESRTTRSCKHVKSFVREFVAHRR